MNSALLDLRKLACLAVVIGLFSGCRRLSPDFLAGGATGTDSAANDTTSDGPSSTTSPDSSTSDSESTKGPEPTSPTSPTSPTDPTDPSDSNDPDDATNTSPTEPMETDGNDECGWGMQCGLMSGDSCGQGEVCRLIDTDDNQRPDGTFCVPAGDGEAGAPCTSVCGPWGALDSCGDGLVCDVLPSFNADLRPTCAEYCEGSTPCNGVCFYFGAGPLRGAGRGLCRWSCDPLTNMGCVQGQVCYAEFDGTVCGVEYVGPSTEGELCTDNGECADGQLCYPDSEGAPRCHVLCDYQDGPVTSMCDDCTPIWDVGPFVTNFGVCTL